MQTSHRAPEAGTVLDAIRGKDGGMDVFEIASASHCDLRGLRAVLDGLQEDGQVFSGLKKEEGAPSVFRRLYFVSSR